LSIRTRPEALVVMDQKSFRSHFDHTRRDRLQELVTLPEPAWVDELDSPAARARLATAEVLITSWGAPTLTPERLAAAPALRAVFHSAGSVRALITDEVWERKIQVTSAAEANAIPVAEYTLAAIIMAGKKAPFLTARAGAAPAGWGDADEYGHLSNYRRSIGIIGYSRIGRRVVDLLARLDATCYVADPYADTLDVREAGATLIDMYAMLPHSEILSLHAPDLPTTRNMLGVGELALLPDHATIINTARGSLIDKKALTAECRSGRLFAILDVTEPEPLPPDDPLRDMPNVIITPHIAGSLGSEILRLTDLTLDELTRWIAEEPLVAEVPPHALAVRA
jgi:phosphoglycerate dehydrogenase-like enzyme